MGGSGLIEKSPLSKEKAEAECQIVRVDLESGCAHAHCSSFLNPQSANCRPAVVVSRRKAFFLCHFIKLEKKNNGISGH